MSSSSDEEDDIASWQQHRQRIKESNKALQPTAGQKQGQRQGLVHCQTTSAEKVPETENCKLTVKKMMPASVFNLETQTCRKNQVSSAGASKTIPKKSSGKCVSENSSTTNLDLKMTQQDSDTINKKTNVENDKDKLLPVERSSNVLMNSEIQNIEKNALKISATGKAVSLQQNPSKCNTCASQNKKERKTPVRVPDKLKEVPDVSTKTKLDKGNECVNSVKEPNKKERDCSVLSSSKDPRGSVGTCKETNKVLEAQEKAKRARLRKSVENLRPPLSSGGHQPAAPITPIVFDQVRISSALCIRSVHSEDKTAIGISAKSGYQDSCGYEPANSSHFAFAKFEGCMWPLEKKIVALQSFSKYKTSMIGVQHVT